MNIGFIGCGKMGSAWVEGLIDSQVCRGSDIFACDAVPQALAPLVQRHGIHAMPTAAAVAENAGVVMLCVKPQDAAGVLGDARTHLLDKLVVSIAAGVPIHRLQEAAGPGTRIARVMPNTPVLVQKGAAAYALGANATDRDAQIVESIFAAVGRIFRVKEELLDAVTGLSGSGPAYVYVAIEALADAGVLMGLPRDAALTLAAQTVAGAAEMVLKTGQHPAALKDMVASPGGTTIAGIEKLEEAGLRNALIAAVRAATERSRQLGAK